MQLSAITYPDEPKRIPLSGEANWRSFLPGGREMIVMEETSAVSRLVRIALDGSSEPMEFASNRAANVAAVEHSRVVVKTTLGEDSILVSKTTDPQRRANAVFIRVHGGPVRWGYERWAETQLYLEHGVDVIQVEQHSRERGGHVELLVAALDYARETLGVPRERIVVHAASTPAGTVLHTAQEHPEKIGIIALIALYREPLPMRRLEAAGALRVLGFHGGSDSVMAPDEARMFLETAFGKEALRPPRGMWHVFAGEPHSLVRDESHAAIHATILHLLGLAECNR